jgi:peroxiredoxin
MAGFYPERPRGSSSRVAARCARAGKLDLQEMESALDCRPMAVESPAPALGAPCPEFRLPGVDGRTYARDDFADRPVLAVMFICNHCPYVKAVEGRLIALARELGPRGVQLVGVCSNDAVTYSDDAFDKLAARWREREYGFPYLHDETQDVARAFGAVCTPDIFVYDRDRRLAYRGRIDDSWKDETQVKRRELAEALEALLAGRKPSAEQRPSMGCSIKWRSPAA